MAVHDIPGQMTLGDIPVILLGLVVIFVAALVYAKIAVAVYSVRRGRKRTSENHVDTTNDQSIRRVKLNSTDVDATPTYGSVERDFY